jgi:oligopeptide transport system substrate-binding protein
MKKTLILSSFLLLTSLIGYLSYLKINKSNTPRLLSRCMHNMVVNIDPCKISNLSEKAVVSEIFEGLMVRTQSGQVKPSAANVTNYTLSDDKLSYTFNLNPAARWSNGDALTAKDFAYSLKRMLKPKNKCQEAFLLFCIKGAKNYYNQNGKGKIGIKALNNHTLLLRLNKPTPYFTEILAAAVVSPVHKKTIKIHGKKWTHTKHIVTNGPYKVSDYVPNHPITLVINPYHPQSKHLTNKGFHQISYMFNSRNTGIVSHFEANAYDVVQEFDEGKINTIMNKDNFMLDNTLGVYYYAFNMTNKRFRDNPALREALHLCINREHMINTILHGCKKAAYSWVPNGISGYTPPTLPQQKNKEKRAKELYKQAGYGPNNPFVAKILYSSTSSCMNRSIALQIAEMWQRILGIETEYEALEWKAMLSRRTKKEFDIIAGSWLGDYGDPTAFLDIFCPLPDNMPGYNNPAYTNLINRAHSALNNTQRLGLLKQAETILLKDKPIIPIYHTTTTILVNKQRVHGWIPNAYGFHPSWDLTYKGA